MKILNSHLVIVLFFAVFFVSTITAQETPKPVVVNGGVINGKATYLAQPAYPAAAKAVNAEGIVNVQVTIDENGDVISATATSGHPLLRAGAVEAARQSKFKPTTLSGQPVKVTGILVYNFVAAKSNWFSIGSDLSKAELTPMLRYFNSVSILKAIPADWQTERAQIQKLDELKKEELSAQSEPKEVVVDKKTTKSNDGVNSTVTTTKRVDIDLNKELNFEKVGIAQSLIASIQGRLGSDALNLWYFNLGVNVNKLLMKGNVESDRQAVLDAFRQHLSNAPAETPKEVIEASNDILSVMEKRVFDNAALSKVGESLSRIHRVLD